MRSLSVLMLSAVLFLASCSEDDIKPIQADCKKTLSELTTYQPKTINVSPRDGFTNVLTGYFKGGVLKFAVVESQTPSERKMDEFFFDGEDVEYIRKTVYKFNRPTTITPEIAKQLSDTVAYDPTKTKVTVSHYYFYHERMIQWTMPDGKNMDPDNKKFDFEKRVCLNDVRRLKEMIGEKSN